MTETAHTPLPCPLCHAEAPQVYESRYHTHCNKCGTVAPTHSWNTRADSHHRLVEALEALAFVGEDDPKDTQAVWEMIYRDRVQDWFSYEDFERARDVLAALKEAGR